MAQLKIEETLQNQQETDFAATIRTLCDPCGVDMIVGCGGSHIYIHRSSQFVAGDNTNEQNIRWAIITD